jgi:hypothetical protein
MVIVLYCIRKLAHKQRKEASKQHFSLVSVSSIPASGILPWTPSPSSLHFGQISLSSLHYFCPWYFNTATESKLEHPGSKICWTQGSVHLCRVSGLIEEAGNKEPSKLASASFDYMCNRKIQNRLRRRDMFALQALQPQNEKIISVIGWCGTERPDRGYLSQKNPIGIIGYLMCSMRHKGWRTILVWLGVVLSVKTDDRRRWSF